MTEAEPLVFVVDDDPAIRESLKRLFKSVGTAIEDLAAAVKCYENHTNI